MVQHHQDSVAQFTEMGYGRGILGSSDKFGIHYAGSKLEQWAESRVEGGMHKIFDLLVHRRDTKKSILQSEFVAEQRHKGVELAFAAVQDHWSTERCISIRDHSNISIEKYLQLRHDLSYTYTPPTNLKDPTDIGSYTLMEYDGVPFPHLCGRTKMDTVITEWVK